MVRQIHKCALAALYLALSRSISHRANFVAYLCNSERKTGNNPPPPLRSSPLSQGDSKLLLANAKQDGTTQCDAIFILYAPPKRGYLQFYSSTVCFRSPSYSRAVQYFRTDDEKKASLAQNSLMNRFGVMFVTSLSPFFHQRY